MRLCTIIPLCTATVPPLQSPKYFLSYHETLRINRALFDHVYLYPGVTLPTRPWSQWSLQWCPMTTWRARPDWAASTALHAQPRSTRGPGHTGSTDTLMYSVFGHLRTLTELNCRRRNEFSPKINGTDPLGKRLRVATFILNEQRSTYSPFLYRFFHILNGDAVKSHGSCSASMNKTALRLRPALDHHSFITELCAGAPIHPSIHPSNMQQKQHQYASASVS